MTITRLLEIAEYEAARRLPARIVRGLSALKQAMPLRLRQAAPVVQAFIDDGETRSYLGIHNFYSVLLPDVVTEAVAHIELRDGEGRVVVRHDLAISPYGCAMVDVHELLSRHRVRAPVGVATVQLTPRRARDRAYRRLGTATSHFFVHFETDRGAVGQIHPLSVADAGNRASGAFVSSQVVTTSGLVALEALQYNATRRTHRLEHRLFALDSGATVATRRLVLPPLGAALSRFSEAELSAAPRLGFAVDDLPSHNAKPVLRRLYGPGLYSVSHA